MTIYEISKEYNLSYTDFLSFIIKNDLKYENGATPSERSIKTENIEEYVEQFKRTDEYKAYLDREVKRSSQSDESNIAGETPQNDQPSKSLLFSREAQQYNIITDAITIDLILRIGSIRTMGLIARVCAILNPVLTLICAIIGKKRGSELIVPNELQSSLNEAIRHNNAGIALSVILILLDVITGIIIIAIYS